MHSNKFLHKIQKLSNEIVKMSHGKSLAIFEKNGYTIGAGEKWSSPVRRPWRRNAVMSEEYGPDFITVTDEEGNDIELELLDVLEHNGQTYMAFFPAVLEEGDEDSDEYGMVILKSITENGEEMLSTLDSEEELTEVYDKFMEIFFADEE
jgi:hypothetical protein